MKNNDLIQAIAENTALSTEKTSLLVESVVDLFSQILSEGDSCSIHGFGTFKVKKKAERLSVNPVTKKRFLVPPKLVPSFKAGSNLKKKIKNYVGFPE